VRRCRFNSPGETVLETIEIDYQPRAHQTAAHALIDDSRFSVLVWHRRAGKTVACINHLIKHILTSTLTNARGAYICPYLKQAKKVAWTYLQDYTRQIPGVVLNRSELSVTFPNGGVIYLAGADNPDAMRGVWLDFCVLDEYAQMDPTLWRSVIRPALADRKGKAIIIGTPQGKNAFYRMFESAEQLDGWGRDYLPVADTDCLDPDELLAAQREMSTAEYDQEFNLSWTAAIKGAFFGKEMQQAEAEVRITTVPHDPALGVVTAWDLGIRNSVIWLLQSAGSEVRAIDCRFYQETSLQDIVKDLQDLPYIWLSHILPHDVRVREFGTGRTRVETLQQLGITPRIARNIPEADGIEAVRFLLPRMWFDKTKCALGIEALTQFRTEYNELRQNFSVRPLEDWTNHFADALRMYAVEHGDNQLTFGGWEQQLDYGSRNAAIA